MKRFYLLLLSAFMLVAIRSTAQLNYIFSATTKPYIPVSGGISPHLIMVAPFNANPPWTLSDEGFAHVPIGFTFNYDGKAYDSVSACANGFVTLGDTIFRRLIPLSLYVNHIAGGPFPVGGIKPVLAPFWDDLDIVDTLNMVYKTTGHFPFRVFTVEWKKTKWTFESTQPALSMELKLYETTNIIEFHYKDEGGTPFTPRAFASIGITSSYNNRGFMSLQNTSANPTISLIRPMDSLTSKPANNQVYRFIPAIAKIPGPLHSSLKYTNNSVSFKLNSPGFHSYEYAITQSSLPPLLGNRTFSQNVTASSLSPATTYYVYARSKWFEWFSSQWTCDSFTTAVNPVSLPYHVGGDPALYPYLPPDMRMQEMRDTAGNYFLNSDETWNVIVDFPNIGDTSLWSLNTLDGFSADNWAFTPGLKLTAGKKYVLKFGYLSYPSQGPSEASTIEVKYGRETGAAAMTSGTLFKKTDFITDFNEDGSISFTDTTIEIAPDHSGVYYFGFHNLTPYNDLTFGAVPVLGNISITEKISTADVPYVLTGNTNNTDNILNWAIKDNKTIAGFEIQRSSDGINFTKIGDVSNTMRSSKNHTTFRMQRIVNRPGTVNPKFKDPKAVDDKPLFELQRSDDGINFKKVSASNPKSINKTDTKINYDYVDQNVKGINYYRLQHIDKNGKASYSNVVALSNNALSSSLKIYPNPAKDVLNIAIPFGTNKEMTVLVTDVSGRKVLRNVIQTIKGGGNVQLDISHLTPGLYFLKLVCSDGCENAAIKFEKK